MHATLTATVSAISTQSSGGLKPAVVGGIAAGIVAGLLLIGALAFFFILRPKNQEGNMVHYEEGQAQMGEQEAKGVRGSDPTGARTSRGY